MELYKSLLPVIGPVLAAMIAGAIAFIVAVLTKENKTSEFRQAWIEAVRNDVAEIVSEMNVLEGLISAHRDVVHTERLKKGHEFWKEYRKELAKIDAACSRVILRLNPKEHAGLIEKIHSFENAIGCGMKENARLCNDLVSGFSIVLKTEWTRVKRGELTFRILKWTAGGLVLSALAAFVFVLSRML